MLCILVIMFVIAIGGGMYFLSINLTSRAIIAIVLSFLILIFIITRYHMRIDRDFLVAYVYKGLAILPIIIDFQDIKDVTLLSKHKLKISYPKTVTLYLLNAEAFHAELQEKLIAYKKDRK